MTTMNLSGDTSALDAAALLALAEHPIVRVVACGSVDDG